MNYNRKIIRIKIAYNGRIGAKRTISFGVSRGENDAVRAKGFDSSVDS